jgi:hypothetical protein
MVYEYSLMGLAHAYHSSTLFCLSLYIFLIFFTELCWALLIRMLWRIYTL